MIEFVRLVDRSNNKEMLFFWSVVLRKVCSRQKNDSQQTRLPSGGDGPFIQDVERGAVPTTYIISNFSIRYYVATEQYYTREWWEHFIWRCKDHAALAATWNIEFRK